MNLISSKYKNVGHRGGDTSVMPVGTRLRQADTLQRTVLRLRGTNRVCRRGLFRFRTFEEADEWMEAMILASIQESPR